MRVIRIGLTALAVAVGGIAVAPPASAVGLPVGVNGCEATSVGSYIPGVCTAAVLPGYYFLTVSSTGDAYASVDCSPLGGSGSAANGGGGSGSAFFYVPGGDCSVAVYGEVTSIARLFAA